MGHRGFPRCPAFAAGKQARSLRRRRQAEAPRAPGGGGPIDTSHHELARKIFCRHSALAFGLFARNSHPPSAPKRLLPNVPLWLKPVAHGCASHRFNPMLRVLGPGRSRAPRRPSLSRGHDDDPPVRSLPRSGSPHRSQHGDRRPSASRPTGKAPSRREGRYGSLWVRSGVGRYRHCLLPGRATGQPCPRRRGAGGDSAHPPRAGCRCLAPSNRGGADCRWGADQARLFRVGLLDRSVDYRSSPPRDSPQTLSAPRPDLNRRPPMPRHPRRLIGRPSASYCVWDGFQFPETGTPTEP